MTDDPAWMDFFGFDTPYENQADAIESAINVGRLNGYLVMEGPCGTGKTMAALTAAASLIRRSNEYDRTLIVTPVKQQLQQFITDLRTMNSGLDTPFDGVALVGKADLCPYGREGAFPEDIGVHTRCQNLRESTAELVEKDDGILDDRTQPISSTVGAMAPTTRGSDEQWWDSNQAHELVQSARLDAETHRTLDPPLTTADVEAPYPRHQPAAPEHMAASENPPLYCPFEADWYARNKNTPVRFEHGDRNVLAIDEYLPNAVKHGTCPHRTIGVLLEKADMVIGNYNHLFDLQTRALTESILDERTFVIIDEAHRLEERVRDLLSEQLDRQTLRRTRNDFRTLLRFIRQEPENRRQAERRLRDFGVSITAVEQTVTFYDDVLTWLHEQIESYMNDEFDDLNHAIEQDTLPTDNKEIELRDPDINEPDELTEWATEQGYDLEFWESLSTVGNAVERTLGELEPDRSCMCTAVGDVMERWRSRDHIRYFREIVLEHKPAINREPTYDWERVYTPRLEIYNCMPAGVLASIFDSLGGGILMSATLEPLNVFREVSGLNRLTNPAQGEGRPITEQTYELPFPEDYRASWIVDIKRFTLSNRGESDVKNRNDLREQYARVLCDIARSPGNIMLCLPNYQEAAWAGERLRDSIDKPVLIDESSTTEATNELKQNFFQGEGKVLVTSTRGTLTEGIDYNNDKLHTCAVVGVPFVSIGSPRVQAVQHAYADAFGSNRAFDYALTVPAVRRARQAIGRVIRGPGEQGVRIFVDERYTETAHYSVYEYLAPDEQEEFTRMKPMFLNPQFEQFWNDSNLVN